MICKADYVKLNSTNNFLIRVIWLKGFGVTQGVSFSPIVFNSCIAKFMFTPVDLTLLRTLLLMWPRQTFNGR